MEQIAEEGIDFQLFCVPHHCHKADILLRKALTSSCLVYLTTVTKHIYVNIYLLCDSGEVHQTTGSQCLPQQSVPLSAIHISAL